MLKAIIFDAFGTLFKVDAGGSAKKIIQNIISEKHDIDEQAFTEKWKAYYRKHTSSGCEFHTEREIFTSRIQMFYNRYKINRNAERDADALNSDAFERRAFEEAVWVIKALRSRYKVLIGSNTDNDVIETVMRKNGIAADGVYTSENLKCYKPDPIFFRKILVDNDLLANEVLFVGDSVRDDVLGPKNVGIKTVLLDRNGIYGDVGQDFTIKSLDGLLTICEEINKS